MWPNDKMQHVSHLFVPSQLKLSCQTFCNVMTWPKCFCFTWGSSALPMEVIIPAHPNPRLHSRTIALPRRSAKFPSIPRSLRTDRLMSWIPNTWIRRCRTICFSAACITTPYHLCTLAGSWICIDVIRGLGGLGGHAHVDPQHEWILPLWSVLRWDCILKEEV